MLLSPVDKSALDLWQSAEEVLWEQPYLPASRQEATRDILSLLSPIESIDDNKMAEVDYGYGDAAPGVS